MRILGNKIVVKPIEDVNKIEELFVTQVNEYTIRTSCLGVVVAVPENYTDARVGDKVYFEPFRGRYIEEEKYYVVPLDALLIVL
jgi:co-chaperonin GroES (HSP10)